MRETWLHVKVHPNAGKDVLISLGPGRFEAWIKAKPMEGRANEALAALLARSLQIPRDQLRLMKGHSGRHKIFRVIGEISDRQQVTSNKQQVTSKSPNT